MAEWSNSDKEVFKYLMDIGNKTLAKRILNIFRPRAIIHTVQRKEVFKYLRATGNKTVAKRVSNTLYFSAIGNKRVANAFSYLQGQRGF